MVFPGIYMAFLFFLFGTDGKKGRSDGNDFLHCYRYILKVLC